MKVDAVVLGGGDGAVIDPHCKFKGLAPIGGKPLIAWVVDALRAADLVEEIAAVVPTAEDLGSWADTVDKLVVSDRTFMGNVLAGIGAFRVDRPVLVTTGDLPLLTGAALDDFISRSLATGADFTYPLVLRADMEVQYPGSVRTYVKVDGVEVTGGNMMLLNPALTQQNARTGEELFRTRKSPLAMARILGLRFAVAYALGRLTVADVERKMTQLLGGTTRAISTSFGSIGVDVDKPADVLLAERMLQ